MSRSKTSATGGKLRRKCGERGNSKLICSVWDYSHIFSIFFFRFVHGTHDFYVRSQFAEADRNADWRLTLLFPCCTLRRKYSYSKFSEKQSMNFFNRSLCDTFARASDCNVELKYWTTDRAKSLLAARACLSLNSIQPVPSCGVSGTESIAT